MKDVEEFRYYLQTLGYSNQTCYELPNTIIRFKDYFKQKKKTQYRLSKKDVSEYIYYIKDSISEKTKKKRSVVQTNSYIYALRHYNRFLHTVKNTQIPIHHLEYFKDNNRGSRIPLTIEEIKKLFDATDNTKYGIRDRAMLTIYYSCGLRRNEGLHIQTTDIDLNKRILFVREGKFGKQRYVPFTEQSKKYLQEYLYTGRRRFVRKGKVKLRKTLFISRDGEALQSQSLQHRLKLLKEKAQIEKKVGLHILRHSIATHLLQKGMSIYTISQFLGHSTIESTQIYTHIIENEIL